MTDLSELSEEQLEEALAAKRKNKEMIERKAREAYERQREDLIRGAHLQAERHYEELSSFKQALLADLEEFYNRMAEYGDIAKNSNGGYGIKSLDGTLQLQYKIQTLKSFDERADMAEAKLLSFLERFVKARNKKTYKLVISLLERTNSGDFDINMINRLYKMEKDFEDEDWREAIRLFKESYSPEGSARYIMFKKRDENTGKWNSVILNFSSI